MLGLARVVLRNSKAATVVVRAYMMRIGVQCMVSDFKGDSMSKIFNELSSLKSCLQNAQLRECCKTKNKYVINSIPDTIYT
jgi:hypothetical protein